MKKVLVLAAALMLFAAPAMAVISNSAHDFTQSPYNAAEICVFCHTPHGAANVADAPLWNHQLTTSTFTVYSSTTIDGSVSQPSGRSILCLSCHDGSVAIDSYGGATGTTFINGVADAPNSPKLGTNLQNDHPVSITYRDDLDSGLRADDGTGASVTNGSVTLPLYSNKVECASCHDVHNGSGFNPMLRADNGGSALCLVCHDK
ncbi:cytochrome C [Geothermobacter hydrogeniphilus]|uniref:Cytochrome C n=1 Tax=Geothermobacter hydrogeniphilus TaxID=1969733 RepID=A0A2K2H5Z8_9BACT|nr:cytochrome c3 family protein [Geothermobacter hydrogeniphilus]PNU18728.1 cytochrome C [Geothermobacter hydrogeniphilus]